MEESAMAKNTRAINQERYVPSSDKDLEAINLSIAWAGFKQFLPISAFVVLFGLAFGLAATQTGLSTATSLSRVRWCLLVHRSSPRWICGALISHWCLWH